MRSYLALFFVCVAAAALLSTSGCVSKAEYDKALAACRRANDELLKSQEELRAAREELEAMKVRLAQGGMDSEGRDKEIALLEAKARDLQDALDKLQALYNQALAGDVPPPVGPVVVLPAALDEALKAWAAQHPDLVEYLPEYGMVKFKADFTFDKGSDDLSPSAVAALGKLVEILNSQAAANFHVYIAGHTDNIPIKKPDTLKRHPTNWYLSVHRSVEVQKQLTKDGLNPFRIGVMGFGEYHPIAANDPGQKGNAKNRRVEIWIVPPGRFLTPPTGGSSEPAAAPAAAPAEAAPAAEATTPAAPEQPAD